jgi:hypothetical protein
MLEQVIGQQKFYQILTSFLKKHAYGSASYEDFVHSIEQDLASPTLCGTLTIREFVDDFLTQLKSPVVEINLTREGNIEIKQNDPRWNVPLFLNDGSLLWLLKDGSLCPNGLKFNAETLFNYRSYSFATFRYSPNYWRYLLSRDLTKIDELTLLGLANDLAGQASDQGHNSKQWDILLKGMIQKIFLDFKGNVSPYILDGMVHLDKAYFEPVLIQLAYRYASWNALELRNGHFSSQVLHKAVKYDIGDARDVAFVLFEQLIRNCGSLETLETCNR